MRINILVKYNRSAHIYHAVQLKNENKMYRNVTNCYFDQFSLPNNEIIPVTVTTTDLYIIKKNPIITILNELFSFLSEQALTWEHWGVSLRTTALDRTFFVTQGGV